ncbi:OLC1v1003289C1 [Oldenlandia corymbosa var. corymbosa]|uniref:Transcription repressor n=1 Tax=Oldenlandia corymbosa var. corymbosa TaxID=529605 RepID=A0AAV1D9W5_OLDCO|nr:OLC1v1003289C1 [Oldenlandia corymbosa var. corymbosa]
MESHKQIMTLYIYIYKKKMPNQIQKSLQDYISKMKQKPNSQNQFPPTPRSISSSTSWILRGCKHPRTPSFSSSSDQNKNNGKESKQHSNATSDHDAGAATLADVDRFLSENFKTLYENQEEEQVQDVTEMMIKTRIDDDHQAEKEESLIEIIPISGRMPARRINPRPRRSSSDRVYTPPPAAASAGSISSDDVSSTSTTTAGGGGKAETEQLSPDDFITVLTYSRNPYDDFKNSMQEMIDARLQHNGKINWEFMEELLFCYLNLNDKKSHRFILRAFVDLVVTLCENQGCVVPAPRKAAAEFSVQSQQKVDEEYWLKFIGMQMNYCHFFFSSLFGNFSNQTLSINSY